MSVRIKGQKGDRPLMMGNEAIARGALEGGVRVAVGYPGTPSSEIIEALAEVGDIRGLYVEWSTNEKVAMEVAAAASFARLRAICVLKQNGLHVASDFLLHLGASGIRGGMVVIPCDDPGGLSSINEGDIRYFSRMLEIPLVEPGDFQEVKDMTAWALSLSEEIRSVVMMRSTTRLSHASGNVVLGDLPVSRTVAEFRNSGPVLDPEEGVISSAPVTLKHTCQQEKLNRARAVFESCRFNTYTGPERPRILIVTSSACNLYCREAVELLGVTDQVGIFKLGTTWPLPENLVKTHLKRCERILVVEEIIPFLEENLKVLAQEAAAEIGHKHFYGKRNGTLPAIGELNPDRVMDALAGLLEISYQAVPKTYAEKAAEIAETGAPPRDWTLCPGCPHRASFWNIRSVLQLDNRRGFVCGDIGCYTMGIFLTGFHTLKTLHSMGSGTGLASGFGQLAPFGLDQPVLSVCGDSTFFHSVMPALVNAIHHRSDITLVVLDNGGTAMTGFQPHPGLPVDARGGEAVKMDIAAICRAMGAEVRQEDPFDFEETRKTLLELLEKKDGVKVLILEQACALSPQKKRGRLYQVAVDPQVCIGEECGCNRLCTRVFRCPGLVWEPDMGAVRIDDAICTGCGVCASVCPAGAISRTEAV